MPTQDIETVPMSSYAPTYWSRHREWTVTPNYADVPRADLPINPYRDTTIKIRQDHRGAAWMKPANGEKQIVWPGGYAFSGPVAMDYCMAEIRRSSFDANATSYFNSLLIDLLGKVSDAKVNIAVAFAEFEKTVSMLESTVTRVAQAYRSFRRGRLGDVAKYLNISPRRVHKTWLEYKYGWMPLLMDVKNGAEHLAQTHLGRPLRFTVSKFGRMPFNWQRFDPQPAWGGGAYVEISHSLFGDYTPHVKLDLELHNPNLSTLQQLGLTNPALVAWELVPFSFVFDWFYSVGSYLQGLTALHGVTIRRSMKSNVNNLVYSYSQPATTRVDAGGWTYFNPEAYVSVNLRDYARGPYDVDVLTLSVPSKVESLNLTKFFTSLALWKSARR